MKLCNNPCIECPYLKGSMPGYFGGNDPQEYAHALHADTIVPCHMRSTYDDDEEVSEVTICVGHLMAQKKVCKSNSHPEAVKALKSTKFKAMFKKHKADVLGFDFYEHHGVEYEIKFTPRS